MTTIKLTFIITICVFIQNCTIQKSPDLPAHFHAEAQQTEDEIVEVRLKMPARFGETPIYLAKFEPVGRILPAPQEGVKNPGREEVRIGTFHFSDNPEEEMKKLENQGDNEIYAYEPDCDFLRVQIRLNPEDLKRVKFASANVEPPKGVKKQYENTKDGEIAEDECYKPFTSSIQPSGPNTTQFALILFHPGHVPVTLIEPGMDGIPIE